LFRDNDNDGKKKNKEALAPIVQKALCEMFSEEWLRKTAQETGLIKRERKIDVVVLFWVLVCNIGPSAQRSFAGFKRRYEDAWGGNMSISSFYERFSPELVEFLHQCVLHGIEHLGQLSSRTLTEKLSGFKDIVIQDSSIIRLHKKLAKKWPAARTRKVAAGIKLATLVSAVSDGPKRVQIFGERVHDTKTIRIGPWVKDRILLLDLGFFKYQLFDRIARNGGFFVSRLKSNADPVVVSANRIWRGNSIDIVGKKVSEFLPKLKRGALDAEVEVSFKRRAYGGHSAKDTECFRLVCVYNEEAKEYHAYITNIPADRLDANDIARLYGARWTIELVFKELKSLYKIDEIPTANQRAVESLLWTAILTMLVSRRFYLIVLARNPHRAVRFTHMRWARVFAEKSMRLCDVVLDYMGLEYDIMTALDMEESQALDPNVNRHRLMEDWVD